MTQTWRISTQLLATTTARQPTRPARRTAVKGAFMVPILSAPRATGRISASCSTRNYFEPLTADEDGETFADTAQECEESASNLSETSDEEPKLVVVPRSVPCLSIHIQNVNGLGPAAQAKEWLNSTRAIRDGRRPDVTFWQDHRASTTWAAQLAGEYRIGWGYKDTDDAPATMFWKESGERAGGVAILIPPRSGIAEAKPLWFEQWSGDFMAISGLLDGNPITLINVYGPRTKKARAHLFRKIKALGRPAGLVVLGGDFNCVLDIELDRSKLTSDADGSEELQALLADWDLVDVLAPVQLGVESTRQARKFHELHHTFKYIRNGKMASSRLDRVYISSTALRNVVAVETRPPPNPSDHDEVKVIMTLRDPRKSKRGRRRPRALRYPLPSGCLSIVRQVTENALNSLETSPGGSEQTEGEWDPFKISVRKQALSGISVHKRKITRAFKRRARRLRSALRQAEEAAKGNLIEIQGTVASITSGLSRISLDHAARATQIRAEIIRNSQEASRRRERKKFAKYAGSTADVTRAFFSRLRERTTARMSGPPVGGGSLGNPADRTAADWRPITQRGPCPEPEQDTFFATLPPPRATADSTRLLDPISEDEVKTAIAACPRGKAAGPDGLPNDWYRDHADLLAPVLTRLFNTWFSTANLPLSFRQAAIVCIISQPVLAQASTIAPLRC